MFAPKCLCSGCSVRRPVHRPIRRADRCAGHRYLRDVAPSAKLVTNIWVDTDLRQVIQDISSQTDTAIMCDQTVQGIVSMSVKNMPLGNVWSAPAPPADTAT